MYTEQQLADLVATVEREFNAELAKAESLGSMLAKAEDAPPAAEDEKSEEKAPEEKPAPKADGEEKAPEAKPEAAAADAKPEGDEEAAAPAAEEGAAAEAAPCEDGACDYDEEDLAAMQKMYSSMSKGELLAHHDACRAALDAQGMEKCGSQEQAAAPAAAPEMAKSEKVEAIEVPANIVEVETLKTELAAQMAKSEELKKNFDAVSEFLTKLVKKTAPQGKAITSLEVVAKSEGFNQPEKTLTKSEVTEILKKKDYSTMAKSDRDAIQAFYSGNGTINSINHLLK